MAEVYVVVLKGTLNVKEMFFSYLDLVKWKLEIANSNDYEIIKYDTWQQLMFEEAMHNKINENIGGFQNADSPKMLLGQAKMITVYADENHVYAAATYSVYLGGLKMTAVGSDSSSIGKQGARMIIQRDIQDFKGGYWCEASDAVENLFKKYNGYPIPSVYANEILGNRGDIKLLNDGVHYTRPLKDFVATKMLFGFKDEEIYKRVTQDMDKYNDFRNRVNNVSESNDVDNIIKNAIYEIYSIDGYLSDYGFKEITYSIKNKLENALKIIVDNKTYEQNDDIDDAIELAQYILDNYTVLELHKF